MPSSSSHPNPNLNTLQIHSQSTSNPINISQSILPNLAIFNRIYVGSIFFELTEAEITSVFSVFGPIKVVLMVVDPITKRHRGYGFIEYETADAAALAQLSMDNAELGGRHIKVGRPNNFPSDLPPGVPRPLPNRIYVSNVHELIQEDEIKAIFEAFGPLKHCNLFPDIKLLNQHRGFGYVEYEIVADAINAMNSLNNFELAGRQLKIGKTVIGGPIPYGMKEALTLKLKKENCEDDSKSSSDFVTPAFNQIKLPSAVLRAAQQINAALGNPQSIQTPPPPKPEITLPPKVTPIPTSSLLSTVVVMTNLIDPQELEDPEEAKELEEDITSECEKFGPLADPIQIYINQNKTVSVFVKYTNLNDCSEAIARMNGRWFGGRQICALAFPVDLYDSRNFC